MDLIVTKEIKPKIIFYDTFTENTFFIKHVNSKLQLNDIQIQNIDSTWKKFKNEAKSRGAHVWDGTYYRLENTENIKSNLEFSTINYSTIRGLTFNQDISQIPFESRPNHISTASLIKTSDGLFVFGVRNSNSMSSRKIDLIGGGLQPEELKVENCGDIFKNQVKEMSEEIGILPGHISSINGIGITLSSKYNVIFIFYTKLTISKNQLFEIFKYNTDDEMQNLKFVYKNDLEDYLSDKGSYRPLTTKLYANFHRTYNNY